MRVRTSGGWRSALFVAVLELAGSFAYFGVSANLITYLTAAAAAGANAWSGTAGMLPLLGAFLGRYRCILSSPAPSTSCCIRFEPDPWCSSKREGIISVAIAVVSYIQENVGFGTYPLHHHILRLRRPSPWHTHLPPDASNRLSRRDKDGKQSSEEARGVLCRLLPIWAACLAYAQIMTLFNKQGRILDRRIGDDGALELPPVVLQTFGPVTIVVFVPI
uniref:Uncharacterized protein n=1 Tax=Oryza punctata TaxID=4537 RepID=A0A0E0LX60_ORYPU